MESALMVVLTGGLSVIGRLDENVLRDPRILMPSPKGNGMIDIKPIILCPSFIKLPKDYFGFPVPEREKGVIETYKQIVADDKIIFDRIEKKIEEEGKVEVPTDATKQ